MYRDLIVSLSELGGCSPVHSAYIPGLATSGGFWRHMAAQPFSRVLIVFPGQSWLGLVVIGAPAGFEPALMAPEGKSI